MRRVFAIAPAHNESATVREVVCALQEFSNEVVVVADGCTDDTAERAQKAGATVLVRVGPGDKSRALATGLRWVAERKPADEDIVLFVDADTGTSAREAARLVEAVAGGRAPMAVGVLPSAGRRGGFGQVARFARWVLKIKTGTRFRAPLSGQRAVCWGAMRRVRALAGGFGVEVGMTIDLMRLGVHVQEVEVNMTHRHTGRSWRGFLHRARQGCHVLLASMGLRGVPLWTDD